MYCATALPWSCCKTVSTKRSSHSGSATSLSRRLRSTCMPTCGSRSKPLPVSQHPPRIQAATGQMMRCLIFWRHSDELQILCRSQKAKSQQWRGLHGPARHNPGLGIKDKLMQQIRYLDKLVDELARGKP